MEFIRPGAKVTFSGLQEIIMIVEEAPNEQRGNVRCKYFDDKLHRWIKLTLPVESLQPYKHPKKENNPKTIAKTEQENPHHGKHCKVTS
jgi:hypothetical protein